MDVFLKALRQRLNIVQKSARLAASHDIVQFPVTTQRNQTLHHRPERRDADAASQKDTARRIFNEMEVIEGATNFKHIANLEPIVP